MREYSIRSSQLRNLKNSLFLKEIIVGLLTIGFGVALLVLFIVGDVAYNDNSLNNAFFKTIYDSAFFTTLIYIFIVLIIGIAIFITIFVIKRDNKFFHNRYLEYIFEECKLNDIYYKFRKKTFDKSLFEELEELVSVKDIERIFEISDVSTERYIEYNQIRYKKAGSISNGVLIVLRNSEPLEGFFQIRTRGEPSKNDYEGKTIHRFGFQKTFPTYDVFSSLGSSTYKIANDEFDHLINDFKRFVRCNFVITRLNSTISIFLETFQFNLTSDLLSSYHEKDFDNKVDAMIRLHELTDEIINKLLSLKI